MFIDALNFAHKKHVGQFRRGTGLPYITHPIAVSKLVESFTGSNADTELLAAALLHDCLEDTDTTFTELQTTFSPKVALLVNELTNDEAKMREVGKLEYQTQKLLKMSSQGLVIKLADRLHNIADRPSFKMLRDTQTLLQHLKTGRELTMPQTQMVFAIDTICEKRIAAHAS